MSRRHNGDNYWGRERQGIIIMGHHGHIGGLVQERSRFAWVREAGRVDASDGKRWRGWDDDIIRCGDERMTP